MYLVKLTAHQIAALSSVVSGRIVELDARAGAPSFNPHLVKSPDARIYQERALLNEAERAISESIARGTVK